MAADSGSISDSSCSDMSSSAGGLDGAASGARVVVRTLSVFVAASALSLAAAIALKGFSALVVTSAYLVRMSETR